MTSTTPLVPAPIATKIHISLLSVAICDALGGPAEFHRRGTFPHITSFVPNNNFGLPAGCWTDDTSMALCLADSLINSREGFSEADQGSRYVRWVDEGYLSATGTFFDAGMATRVAVDIWRSGRGLQEIKKSLDHKNRCGNGSLMRVLPVALAYWRDAENAKALARRSSAVTHPHSVCQEACALYVSLVVEILRRAAEGRGMKKSELLGMVNKWEWQTDELSATFADGKWVAKEEAKISSSGYVVHTLEAALWVFFRTDSFEEGAIDVVNLGDDADTVAAVYGGIAGAWYGADGKEFWSAKVKEWGDGLVRRDVVEGFGEGLATLDL
ncbi:ADP-ribosylglycohydrolase [Tricharina praecox]|uniref:ADP-ribosylglycohydrolase n=1 Tax=Tricharina praecox TaxID=43433 RepID=UPI00221FF5E6|nr:ADP-ribosylglycohydrolase [Tricharina praecox]KAI5851804.1 ADP-ribosylglycohydrolase [Tricharina praecox]